jgi:hypothetical protein
MNKQEIEKTRCLIAQVVNQPPDDINIVCFGSVFFGINDYEGFNCCLAFDKVPSIKDIKEELKDIFLMFKEWEWEEKNN